MGAWGFALFQSDNDMDIIGELSDEAGVEDLHKEASKPAVKTPGSADQTPDAVEAEDGVEYFIYESILGSYTTNRDLVRKHLDSGVLAAMFAKYESKLLAGETEFLREPGYIFMLLGACAMTLGCTIPKKYKTTMKKVYMCVGLPRDVVRQMNKALNGPHAYTDGEPYDFDSPGLLETANASIAKEKQDSNPAPFTGLNVWGPGTMFYNPPKGNTKGLEELKAAKMNETKYGNDVCGGCGAKSGQDGGALQACGMCRVRKYCGKKCQAQQWKFHQEVCEGMKKGGKENEPM